MQSFTLSFHYPTWKSLGRKSYTNTESAFLFEGGEDTDVATVH